MANQAVFGPLWTATSAERAILKHLAPAAQYTGGQNWLSTYLAEVEDNEPGLAKGDLIRPRSWQADIDVGRLPETQVPAIVVVVGDETPEKDGQYLHNFVSIAIGVIVRGTSRAHGRDIARQYTAAIKGALLHHPDVNNTFAHLSYDGATYGELQGDTGVVAATASVVFTALVPNTIDLWAGPNTALPAPPDGPGWPDYPDWPTVDETIVTAHPDDDLSD